MDPFGDKAKDVVNSSSDAEEEDDDENGVEDAELGERVPLDEAEVLHLAENIGCAPVGLEEFDMTGLHIPCNFPIRLLWEWLRVHKAVSLRKLAIRLDYMDDVDMPAFARYLQAAGGSVKHLKLALGLSGRDVGDMPEVMALEEARVQLRAILQSFISHEVLAHSNGLESVSLELIYFYDIGNDRPLSLLSLEEMVKAIPGKSLKRLEIQVWTDLASDGDVSLEVEARKWKSGDTILADQDVFPELKEVVVTVTVVEDINFTEYYSGEMDGLDGEDSTVNEGLISKRLELLFPKCLERGIPTILPAFAFARLITSDPLAIPWTTPLSSTTQLENASISTDAEPSARSYGVAFRSSSSAPGSRFTPIYQSSAHTGQS
ncbi:hypothetical protein VNI00_009562 [Paramarasmius palmivorus]|uniref:Uncharacterized protein n=1 Tax=Paramarasmius palmivorus TaxID=297713 RepID=A0AAW0CQ57_9AGAR